MRKVLAAVLACCREYFNDLPTTSPLKPEALFAEFVTAIANHQLNDWVFHQAALVVGFFFTVDGEINKDVYDAIAEGFGDHQGKPVKEQWQGAYAVALAEDKRNIQQNMSSSFAILLAHVLILKYGALKKEFVQLTLAYVLADTDLEKNASTGLREKTAAIFSSVQRQADIKKTKKKKAPDNLAGKIHFIVSDKHTTPQERDELSKYVFTYLLNVPNDELEKKLVDEQLVALRDFLFQLPGKDLAAKIRFFIFTLQETIKGTQMYLAQDGAAEDYHNGDGILQKSVRSLDAAARATSFAAIQQHNRIYRAQLNVIGYTLSQMQATGNRELDAKVQEI